MKGNLNDKSTLLRCKGQFLVLYVLNKATRIIIKELVPVPGINVLHVTLGKNRQINIWQRSDGEIYRRMSECKSKLKWRKK